MHYKIVCKEYIKTEFKNLECLKIVSSATSELGQTHLTSYFNKDYGFVKLEYINIDGSKININLTEMSKYNPVTF